MTTLGEQFMAIMSAKLPDALSKGESYLAKMIADQMEENTENGRAFGNDQYDPVYAPVTVINRQKMGLQTGRVTLRENRSRIETTIVTKDGSNGTVIRFGEGGKIFKEHHEGRRIGGKYLRLIPVRSIFPKTRESVPEDMIEDTVSYMGGIICGSK